MFRKIISYILIFLFVVLNGNNIFAGLINQRYLVDQSSLPKDVADDINKRIEKIKNEAYYNFNSNNSSFTDGSGCILMDDKVYEPIISYISEGYSNIFQNGKIEEYDKDFRIYYAAMRSVPEVSNLNIKKICLGDYGIILKNDGTIIACGDNYMGQLGNGTTVSSNDLSTVVGLSNVIDISGAGGTSLAVRADGTVYGWGSNYGGILGSKVEDYSTIPVKLETLSNVKRVEAGNGIGVALKYDGSVWVFGNKNIYGDNNIDSSPVQIMGFNDIVDISCKNRHIAALDKEGNIYTWGENKNGELGNGSNTISDFACKINNISDCKKVIAGNNLTLALKKDGTLFAWGKNNIGQLGTGTQVDQYSPIQINIGEKVIDIGTDNFIENYSYALTENGNIYFWGAKNSFNNIITLPTKMTDEIYIVDEDIYEEKTERKDINLNVNNYIIFPVDLYLDEDNFENSYIAVNKLFEYLGYNISKSNDDDCIIISNNLNTIINNNNTSVFYINNEKTILQVPSSFTTNGAGRDDEQWYYLSIGAIKDLFILNDIIWNKETNTLSFDINTSIEKEITVVLNSEALSFDQAPYIENGVTMVPMRAIFEALGAKIYYDADTDTITAFRNDKIIKHTIGDEYIDVNGVWELTLAPSKIVNDTTMIPIRAVSEGLGADVTWDSETRTINITYNNDLEIKSNILDEYRLLAITCANSYSYDYMKNDFENPSSVIIDNANIKSSEVYQGINDFIDFFELKYSPTNYYEVALMDMLYNKNDYYENAKEIMDNDLVKEIYSQFNKKLRENQNANKVTISGLNVFDVDKFYNDLTILDSILVAKDSADAMYDKFMQLYTLSQISDEKIKALEIIATNTTNQDIKTACDNVILAIREANQQTIEEMAANGAFAGMEELANFVVDRGWKELTNLIPGMIEARTIVSAGKLVSNNLYNADEISNDLLTMAAIKEINETVKTAMINHENAFLLNSTGINAVDYIAISKFYMDINKYGCDVVLEFVDDVKYAKNVQNVFDKIKYFFPLLAPFSNINDLLNNYNEENVNALKESVTNIRSMLNSDNYDFFKTYVEFE